MTSNPKNIWSIINMVPIKVRRHLFSRNEGDFSRYQTPALSVQGGLVGRFDRRDREFFAMTSEMLEGDEVLAEGAGR